MAILAYILAASAFFFMLSLVFTLGWCLVTCKWKEQQQQPPLPPSPPSLPILGHSHLLHQPTHRSLALLAKRYGPILRLRLGSRPVLLVSSSSAAEECFSNHNDIIFANRPQRMAGKYMGYNNTMMLFANYGHHWRNLRRIAAMEFFSHHHMQTSSAARTEEIRSLVKCLFQGHSGEGMTPVVLKSKFSELMFNMVLGTITGKQHRGENTIDAEEGRQFLKLVQEFMLLIGVSNSLDFFPVLEWMEFGGIKKRMTKVRDKLDECLQHLIDENQRRPKMDDFSSSKDRETEKKTGKKLIEVLLSLKQTEADYYTDDIIKGLLSVHVPLIPLHYK